MSDDEGSPSTSPKRLKIADGNESDGNQSPDRASAANSANVGFFVVFRVLFITNSGAEASIHTST